MIRGRESGAAVAEFALIMLMLVPIFLGVLQVGLVRHAENTMTACVSEGARVGAQYNRTPDAGAARARSCIANALSAEYAGNVQWDTTSAGGQAIVVVTATAAMQAMGLAPVSAWQLEVSGHAVEEAIP